MHKKCFSFRLFHVKLGLSWQCSTETKGKAPADPPIRTLSVRDVSLLCERGQDEDAVAAGGEPA